MRCFVASSSTASTTTCALVGFAHSCSWPPAPSQVPYRTMLCHTSYSTALAQDTCSFSSEEELHRTQFTPCSMEDGFPQQVVRLGGWRISCPTAVCRAGSRGWLGSLGAPGGCAPRLGSRAQRCNPTSKHFGTEFSRGRADLFRSSTSMNTAPRPRASAPALQGWHLTSIHLDKGTNSSWPPSPQQWSFHYVHQLHKGCADFFLYVTVSSS